VTITQAGQLIGAIISNFTGIPESRIILKNEKYDAPKDGEPYVLIAYDGAAGLVGINSKKDYDASTETMSATTHERFAIELCGFGQAVTDRKNEIPMAMKSAAAIRAAEDAGCSLFVAGPTLDLSAIEGSSALRRYRIPVIISNIERKTIAATLIDKFPATETESEE
jgi:hypothetical protein